MKRLKYLTIPALALLFTLSACTDEETKSRFGNKAYITASTNMTSLLIGDETGYQIELGVSTAKPANREIKFTFAVASGMVDSYNEAYYTRAELLPSANYTLENTTVTVAEGSSRSTECTVVFTGINDLDRETLFVLSVSVTSNDIDFIESNRTHYFAFKAGAIINWAADMDRNNFPVNFVSDVSALQEMTMEAMVWLEHIDDGVLEANIRTFMGVEGGNGMLIRLGDNFGIDEIQVLKFINGNENKYPSVDRVAVPVQKWTHLAFTQSSDNTVKIYIDAELKASFTVVAGALDFSSNFYIGKSYNDSRWWPGMMTEVRLWSVERTQSELLENMYQVDPETPGLVAYWRFDEGAGDNVADHTGNGNNIRSANPLTWVSVSLPEEADEDY